MLVLTRKQGERIVIGEDIVITVVRTKGSSVRVGIQAPAHVPVLRGEIAKAIAQECEPPAVGEDDLAADAWSPAALVVSHHVGAATMV
jgi:carbon storage regulator